MKAHSGDVFWVEEGDRSSFERLVRGTEPDVRRFCAWQMGRGHQYLDDLVQETFLRAFRGLATFRGEAPVVSWLFTIARRVCLDHAERERREERRQSELQRLALSSSATPIVGPATEIEIVVDQLPKIFREAFVLVRIFGMSYDEAGMILGCPRGTIQSRVARARAMLAAAMLAEPLSTPGSTAASVCLSA